MIATHMDAIGMRVSKIVDGFLHITNIGGIDVRVLPGAEVTVHASGSDEELPAVIAMPPARFLPELAGNGVSWRSIIFWWIRDSCRVKWRRKVRVGDLVSFANEPLELAGDVISGHSLDNRASVAALTICLEELQSKPHVWDVWAVATVQEEVSYLGAYSSAFELRPQIAIVVDGHLQKVPAQMAGRRSPWGRALVCALDRTCIPFCIRNSRNLQNDWRSPGFWM